MLTYFSLLDLLRFGAALGVMCYHYFSGSFVGNNPISIFVRYGYLGVELFFIISGFVIFFSVEKPIKDYALGRFLRLYPLFWFCCTLTYIATIFFSHGNALPFSVYLKNLLIINDGKVAALVDGSYWTLTMEILFYTYIGIYTYFCGEKNILYFFISWLFITAVTFLGGFQHLAITKILLAREAPYFIYGGLLAYLYKNRLILSKKIKYLVFMSLAISACLPSYISLILTHDPQNTTNAFGVFDKISNFIVLGFFILVPLAVYFSEKVTKKSFIRFGKILGGITYPLYLIHQKLGSLIIGASFGTITIISVLTALGMILVSYIISIHEEKWRKALYKKMIQLPFFAESEKKL